MAGNSEKRSHLLRCRLSRETEHAWFSTGIKCAIGPVVSLATDFIDNADDVESNTVEKKGGSYCGPAGKHVFQKLPTNYRDASLLQVVFVVVSDPHGAGRYRTLVQRRRRIADSAGWRSSAGNC